MPASLTTPDHLLRVHAFTGGAAVPAARFRVRQYVAPLARLGVAVTERFPALGAYPPAARLLRPAWAAGTLAQRLPGVLASHGADVVLLQREMLSTLVTLEGLTGRPRVLDVDDAIHLFRGGRTARRLAGLCDLVICGNGWLADVYRDRMPNVAVLPTAIDTDALTPAPWPDADPDTGYGVVIGWIGTSGNLRYLDAVAPALAAVLARFPRARLELCCDAPPAPAALPGLPAERIDFTPWSEAAEPGFFARLTVGLMPLADGDWERGKCSFKMLQYMAAGRPSVVSPVGMNRDVLAHGNHDVPAHGNDAVPAYGPVALGAAATEEWAAALSGLIADPPAARAMGAAARAAVEAHYAVAVLAPRLATLLRGVAG
ncbi:glycosyltransferase [Azospirillum halopraeferens]|uniref:glycosyltransferase n=1 Tax=Azospirillum halopraeferens TaxID=34010 RepID=UPI00040472C0|nr:glycosyltransferase [Azospirillum halopraeferens]